MLTFPIPVFTACVLVFAGLRMWRSQGRLSPLVLLLALCAVQSLIIALNLHYGVSALGPVRPVAASMIPPVAWIAFQGRAAWQQLLHALGPLTVLSALLVAPQFLDVLIPGLFAVYGGLILFLAKQGADVQPNALLSSGGQSVRIWFFIGLTLIGSAFSDVVFFATQLAGYSLLLPWIVSIFSIGSLLAIGVLSFSEHMHTQVDEEPVEDATANSPHAPHSPNSPHAPQVLDPQVWERVQAYMTDHKPYLDPDLTLARLSRKIAMPAKTLSSTINLATGGNVSRYINQARVITAQDAMVNGDSVTSAMLLSGFNTKSNFNREFLRVVGLSPSKWLSETQSKQ